MGKRVASVVLDQALQYIKTNCNLQVGCSAEPTNYTEAFTTYRLLSAAMVSGDFTLGNGVSGGNTPRRLIVGAKPSSLITQTGSVNHLALLDTVQQTLLLVTETQVTPVTANGSNTLDIPAWAEEIKAPS